MEVWVFYLYVLLLGKNIWVLQVYWDFIIEWVLMMEWVYGICIDNVVVICKVGFDGVELVKVLLFLVFEGGLWYGLFYGDLYVGNFYVDEVGCIVFFDFGIMGCIDLCICWLFCELVYVLLVKKDYVVVGKIVVFMGVVGIMKFEIQVVKDLECFVILLIM